MLNHHLVNHCMVNLKKIIKDNIKINPVCCAIIVNIAKISFESLQMQQHSYFKCFYFEQQYPYSNVQY